MNDFLRRLLVDFPDFIQNIILGLTHGELHSRLEYIIVSILFVIMAALLFTPPWFIKLGKKILYAVFFAVSPIVLLYVIAAGAGPAGRLVAAWPYFSLISLAFILLYITVDLIIWRPLNKKRKEYYPQWLKPPHRYKKWRA
ncbi:MAG: hypothetical protein ACOY46_09745 [Bacillota bacterium]